MYWKPRDRRNFLDPNLAHPNSLIKKELFRTSKLKIANKPRNSTKHCQKLAFIADQP